MCKSQTRWSSRAIEVALTISCSAIVAYRAIVEGLHGAHSTRICKISNIPGYLDSLCIELKQRRQSRLKSGGRESGQRNFRLLQRNFRKFSDFPGKRFDDLF